MFFLSYISSIQDCPKVFGEKTLPTSLFFSMIAWQMTHPRGTLDLRAKSFQVLDQMVGLCTKTGKFSVHVHHYTGTFGWNWCICFLLFSVSSSSCLESRFFFLFINYIWGIQISVSLPPGCNFPLQWALSFAGSTLESRTAAENLWTQEMSDTFLNLFFLS